MNTIRAIGRAIVRTISLVLFISGTIFAAIFYLRGDYITFMMLVAVDVVFLYGVVFWPKAYFGQK
ncbi:MAG: hypothetical protein JW850_15185 [Thermoflexales bacterium]|nr:hypothetical protein [Thermoflexales bacterium]